MNAEVNVFGVFVPSLLLCAPIAYLAAAVIRQILEAGGLYRLIWHKALFNFAMFVSLLGAALTMTSRTSL